MAGHWWSRYTAIDFESLTNLTLVTMAEICCGETIVARVVSSLADSTGRDFVSSRLMQRLILCARRIKVKVYD